MNRTQSSLRQRERALNRRLMLAFAAVLFIGVNVQIAMLAQLSHQNKQALSLEGKSYELAMQIENLQLILEQHHDLKRITARAQQLGMQLPDESQLRVVNLPALGDSTTAQSAENTGAGEMD